MSERIEKIGQNNRGLLLQQRTDEAYLKVVKCVVAVHGGNSRNMLPQLLCDIVINGVNTIALDLNGNQLLLENSRIPIDQSFRLFGLGVSHGIGKGGFLQTCGPGRLDSLIVSFIDRSRGGRPSRVAAHLDPVGVLLSLSLDVNLSLPLLNPFFFAGGFKELSRVR